MSIAKVAFLAFFVIYNGLAIAKTSVVFINGITTSQTNANFSVMAIAYRYCISNKIRCNDLEFKGIYNATQGFIDDKQELTVQGQAEYLAINEANKILLSKMPSKYQDNPFKYRKGTDEYNLFQGYVKYYLSNIYFEQGLKNSVIWNYSSISWVEADNAVDDISKSFATLALAVINELELDNNQRKVVLVPHSQGNYFAQAIKALIATKYPGYIDRLAIHGVASVSTVAQMTGEHTSIYNDNALLGHAIIDKYNRTPNFEAGWKLGENPSADDKLQKNPDDMTNHGLIETYLSMRKIFLPIDAIRCQIFVVPNERAAAIKRDFLLSTGNRCKEHPDAVDGKFLIGVGDIFPLLRGVPLNTHISNKIKSAIDLANQFQCGAVSSPNIVGQLGPYYTATAGQKIQFTTTPAPKTGYPFGSYNWTTSDSSATLVNNGGTLADFVLNTAGTTTVTVTPVLADGTVCTSSAATAQVVVQPIVTPTFTPSLSISMDAASLATLGATDKGYISYLSSSTSGINKPAVSFLAGGNIVIPNNSSMQFTTGATFDLWARMDSLTGWLLTGQIPVNDGNYAAALLAKSGPYTGATFLTNAYGNASIRTMDSTWWAGGCQTPVYTNIPLNTWHRVTYTMSTTDGMQVYVNKKLVWSCQGSDQSFTVMNNNDLLIGGVLSAWGPYTTPGAIADIKIYKSALTAAQISQLN